MVISNFELQKNRDQYYDTQDDVLKETPKNQVTAVTSFQMLFQILKVPFNEETNEFKIGSTKYTLDLQEMMKDSRKDFRVRTYRCGGGKSENIAHRPPSDFDNNRHPITSMSNLKETMQRAKNKTPRVEALGGIGSMNPGMIDSISISSKLSNLKHSKSPYIQSQNSHSQNNLLVPQG